MYNTIMSAPGLQAQIPDVEKFRAKRQEADLMASLYYELGDPRKARMMSQCGTYLEVGVTSSGARRLSMANFCRLRLCPMCMWRRSLKIFGQLSQVMTLAESRHGYRYLFLTLTVRNCGADDLPGVLDSMRDGFRRLSVKSDRFRRVVRGWWRTMEITRNPETGEYHPHYHVICAVDPGYFQPERYLTGAVWSEMWRESMGLDYHPSCDISAVTDRDGAVAEVTKYVAKPGTFDPEEYGDDVEGVKGTLAVLDCVLHGRRLVGYGGALRRIARELKLDDPVSGDLVHIDTDIRDDVIIAIERYGWRAGVYVLLGREEVIHDGA